MKYLILLIISINTALACGLSIPERDVTRFLNPPVIGHYLKCEDFPEDRCHCVEAIDPWSAELVDNMVIDFIRKEKEESCIDEADCQVKLEALQCQFGNPIKNLESMSVYCALEVMKPDGKKLVNSPEKKARRIQEEKAAEEARIKAEEDRKASRKARIQAAKSIADLKAILLEDEK